MEREVWEMIVTQVSRLRLVAASTRFTFSAREIVQVFLWAVMHHRPVYWACQPRSWPADLRPARLPVASTMTRRLRTLAVQQALRRLERRVRGRRRRGWVHVVDGKPLPIGNHSRDPDAGYGRGAGGKAKGYKLHAIAGLGQNLRAWCVRPIQHDEAKVAGALLPQADIRGYLLADRNYDRNPLYERCRRRQVQLVAPRRYGSGRGLGHHRHSPARRRAIALLEHDTSGFGPALLRERRRIERWFGSLASSCFGLTPLPPWVRRLHRVERWVAGKLIVWHCVQQIKKRAG